MTGSNDTFYHYLDFTKAEPPASCGHDSTTGEDKVCCSAIRFREFTPTPQPPQFPKNSKPRPCMDHTTHCARWVRDYPERCNPGQPGYPFMREACQASCGRCKEKVSKHPLTLHSIHFGSIRRTT